MKRKADAAVVSFVLVVALAASVFSAQPAQSPGEDLPCAPEAAYLVQVLAATNGIDEKEEKERAAEREFAALGGGESRSEVRRRQLAEMAENLQTFGVASAKLEDAAIVRMKECVLLHFSEDSP